MLLFLKRVKVRISELLLNFAHSRFAKTTLLLHSFADSSIFPISIDITLVPISIAAPEKSFIFGLWAMVGSVFGSILSYYIGLDFMSTLGESLVTKFNAQDSWNEILISFSGEYAIWTLIVAAITPLPFSLACMASGLIKMDFITFLSVSILGRTFRFSVIAILIYFFGPAVQVFLDKYSKHLVVFFLISFVVVILILLFIK